MTLDEVDHLYRDIDGAFVDLMAAFATLFAECESAGYDRQAAQIFEVMRYLEACHAAARNTCAELDERISS